MYMIIDTREVSLKPVTILKPAKLNGKDCIFEVYTTVMDAYSELVAKHGPYFKAVSICDVSLYIDK